MAVNKPIFILDNMAKQLYARWYIPSIMAENPSIVKKLNCFFKDFSTEQLKNSVENSINLHKLALSRGLIPGGIVLESKDKQFKIHWFTPAEASGELWFYQSASATVKQPVGWVALPAQDHVDKKNSLIINHKLQLVHGDVFFVPVDGRSTAELVKQAKQNASKKNIPDMIWPETWPINNR